MRDVVVYPGVIMPLFIGRMKSAQSAELAMSSDKRVVLVMQRQMETNDPGPADLYEVGTVAEILELTRTPDGQLRLLIRALARAHIDRIHVENALFADITVLNDVRSADDEILRSARGRVMSQFEAHANQADFLKHLSDTQRTGLLDTFRQMDIAHFVDRIAAFSPLPLVNKQALLEMVDVGERLRYLETSRGS
jgi:ATP-dependent Lon protease